MDKEDDIKLKIFNTINMKNKKKIKYITKKKINLKLYLKQKKIY